MLATQCGLVRAHTSMVGFSATSPIFRWLDQDLNCSWETFESPSDLIDAVRGLPPHLILAGDALSPAELGEMFEGLRSAERTRKLPAGLVLHDPAKRRKYAQILNAGADDLIVCTPDDQPFIRLSALVQRSRPSSDERILIHGDIKIDLRRHRAFRGTRMLDLTSKPFRLLCQLISAPGELFSHDALVESLWNGVTVDERAVRACVLRLRRALNAGGEPDILRTNRGVGYCLASDEEPSNKSAT